MFISKYCTRVLFYGSLGSVISVFFIIVCVNIFLTLYQLTIGQAPMRQLSKAMRDQS